LLGLAVFVSGSVYPSPSVCCDEKDPIKVTLVVILASEQGNTIDPKLKAIAAEVRKLNPNLKSFKLQSMQSKSFKQGQKVSLPAVEKTTVHLTIKHGADEKNRVGLAVSGPGIAEIEYQTVCGKFLPIVTRYHTKKRERLILAIRVQPCRGE
jgi:hypothetical protein